jgi:hypothetical protein
MHSAPANAAWGAGPGPAEATGGIWAWCWSRPQGNCPALIPMVWVLRREYRNPAAAARASRAAPPGRAAIFLYNVTPKLLTSPLDACRTPAGAPTNFRSPWLQAGAASMAKQMAAFFRRFRADGGRMDYLVIDYEASLTSWQLTPTDVAAIEHDPRFPQLRALLGFKHLASVMVAGPDRRKWNFLMGSVVAGALNRAVFQPATAVYPDIRGSNFDGAIMLPPHIAPDLNDHYQPLSCVFGNCQSPAFYGEIGGLAYTVKGGKKYGSSPFALLRYEMIYLQAVQASSRLPVVPWVAYRGYAKSGRYYKELIYQLVLRGCGELLYWNPHAAAPHAGASAADDRALNAYLIRLRGLLGTDPGPPAPAPAINWSSRLVVAARRTTGGRLLYRVTVPPGVRSVLITPYNQIVNIRGRTGFWAISPTGMRLRFTIVGG